jgi:rod shape determining protein RodA
VNERKPLWFVNWPLAAVVISLLAFGSVMVQSATSIMTGGAGLFQRQLTGIAIGLVPLVAAWIFDYRGLEGWIGPLVVLDAVLVIMPRIPGLGTRVNGAASWVSIAHHQLFQPSEPAKIVTIVVMASVIASYKGEIEKPRDVLRVLGILAIPLLLVLAEPDVGTGMVFIALTAGMLLIGGLKPRWFLILGLSGALLVTVLFGLNSVLNRALHRGPYNPAYLAAVKAAGGNPSADSVQKVTDNSVLIKQYQINRLLVFIDPSVDPKGAGYNLAQSKIAIGSGQLAGTGLHSGSQSNLRFLPAQHTDFIFAVTGEQLGFLGGALLLGLYLALLIVSLEVSAQSRDLFGSLIAAGIIAMWTFQILENMGMTMGLMPIAGIPLPFMSFGSSFMVTNLVAVGMLLSVWARRRGVPGF